MSHQWLLGHGPPERLFDFHHPVSIALDGNGFVADREPTPAVRGRILVRIVRIEIEAHKVEKIALDIGHAPGDQAIGPGDHHGNPRHDHAGHFDPSISQLNPIPDVRHPDVEVHIVGQNGATVFGFRAGHSPGIRAQLPFPAWYD